MTLKIWCPQHEDSRTIGCGPNGPRQVDEVVRKVGLASAFKLPKLELIGGEVISLRECEIFGNEFAEPFPEKEGWSTLYGRDCNQAYEVRSLSGNGMSDRGRRSEHAARSRSSRAAWLS